MKFWVLFLLFLGIALYFFFPPVDAERRCYETSKTAMDQIDTDVFNVKISKDEQCSQSTDVVYALESCIQDATRSSTIAIYANDVINRIVSIIRPYGNNVWTQKAKHNEECSQSEIYQLP